MSDHHAADSAERQGRLLDAVRAVSSGLSLPETLRRIVGAARELADARFAALGVIGPDGALADFISDGMEPDTIRAIGNLPEGHGLLGVLIHEPRPLRLPEIGADPRSYGFPAGHPPMHSFLGVPILVRDRVFGNLYLTEKVGGPAFTDADEALVIALAGQAGVAIENARLREEVADRALVEERERIARDLHDTVIQRLFATGMRLQATVRRVDPAAAERIEAAIGELDATIRDMDVLRAALGSERLDYLGFSYGTYLGAKYAEQFPDRVGRFVLDGAVDPSLDAMQVSQGQSTGFQRAFTRFAADCARQDGCPGGGTTAGVIRWVNNLLARLDRSPMPTGRRTPLNQAQALTAIFFSLYSRETWPSLRAGLREASQGKIGRAHV